MIRIKCINPKCTAPNGRFEWDDRAHAQGGPAEPREAGAISFIAECPYCGKDHLVWLKKVRQEDIVERRMKGGVIDR